jgi:hypothetical protein
MLVNVVNLLLHESTKMKEKYNHSTVSFITFHIKLYDNLLLVKLN